MFKMWII